MSCADEKPTSYYALSAATLQRIREMRSALPDDVSSTPGLYSPIYKLILDELRNNPDVDPGTKNWAMLYIAYPNEVKAYHGCFKSFCESPGYAQT